MRGKAAISRADVYLKRLERLKPSGISVMHKPRLNLAAIVIT
jgi:hypothetical protein